MNYSSFDKTTLWRSAACIGSSPISSWTASGKTHPAIFSNAVYLLFILLLVFLGVRKSIPVTFIIVCAAIALGFVWTLVLSIRNLKRFDRT